MYSNRLSEDASITFLDFDPAGGGTLTDAGHSKVWIPMEGYHAVTMICFRTVGSGKIQTSGIYAATDASGTGATLVGTAGGSTNATGCLVGATSGELSCGIVVLEATADEMAAVLDNATHFQPRLSFATAGDEMGVAIIRHRARYPKSGVTAAGNAAI